MFALEITFGGENPSSETVFIRRSVATIGAREESEVRIVEMLAVGCELQISRQLDRSFKVSPMMLDSAAPRLDFLEGLYHGETQLNLGPVALRITALDVDLLLKEAEASDRAGLRVLRQACSSTVPRFPALVVQSPTQMAISFAPDQPVVIGRSRNCSLRIDRPAISVRHARIGFESGEFWVEDLGSSTGTFVNNQQISGRVEVPPGARITLGGDVVVTGVVSEEQAHDVLAGNAVTGVRPAVAEKRFPALVSVAEGVRPARVVLAPGATVVLGRDQGSDMWLGVPHISRRHCVVEITKSGLARLTDTSTNGTLCDGEYVLKNESSESNSRPTVLDFGGNVTVALCYNEEQEQAFLATGGSPSTFSKKSVAGNDADGPGNVSQKRTRRTTTWIQDPQEFLDQGEDSRSIIRECKKLYRGLSTMGRLVLGLAVVGVITLVTIIGVILAVGMR